MTTKYKEALYRSRIDELESALLDLWAWAEDFSSVDIRCRIEECMPDASALCEPEDDGEVFRGGEAAAYERDQMAEAQKLK